MYIRPLETCDVLCALFAEDMTPALNTGMWVIDGSLKGGPKYTQKGPGAHYRGLMGWGEGSKVCSLKVSDCISW